ncbi:hypothetical protein JCM8547_004775 [Rhodosporidiobolus lusitaniae]
MSSVFRLLAAGALASSLAHAHLDLNYPTSSWNFTEEQQETGATCGGGTRVAAVAWGTQNAFVSLSGDEGHSVRILLASDNSTTANVTVESASSFPIVLSESATFSSSGNLCLPVTLPTDYISDIVLVPTDSSAATVFEHEAAVVNPSTGGNYTFYDYYCSNGTIAALDTCSCHCHGDHEHCDESCSAERVSTAAAECAAAASGSSISSSPAASSTASPTASATVGQDAATTSAGGSNGAGKNAVGLAAVLAVAGMVALQ